MEYNYTDRNIGGIYQIKNIKTNKIYIGSAINLYNRFLEHRAELRGGYHQNIYLQRAFNKYGEHNFMFEILEIRNENRDFLFDLEQWYIDILKPEYNISLEVANQPMKTDATKKKQSETRKRLFKENKLKPNGCKKVYLYYKDGSFVGEFETATSAAKYINTTIDKISGVAHGKFNQIKGYKAFYQKQDFVNPFVKRIYKKGYVKCVYDIIDENNNIVFTGDKYQIIEFTGLSNYKSLYQYLKKENPPKLKGKYIIKSKRAAL